MQYHELAPKLAKFRQDIQKGKARETLHFEPLLSDQGLALQRSPQVSSFVIQIGLELTV